MVMLGVVRWWIWRWRWFWWWWHCSGDSRYKPRHDHNRNCDVTKKVLRTIFNSRHAREKLPRRLLGQPGFWRPPFWIIHLQSETIKHFIHLSYYTTPTSPFFSRPNGVVQRISKTIRDLWAREKKFVMSSLPRNLVVKKLLDRLERIAFEKVNLEWNITQ